MKKLLGILAISALAASAFAQGTVILGNQTGLVKQWTSATDTTLISVPKGGGYVELIAAPATTALANPLFTLVGNSATMNYSSIAGFLAANPGWALPSNAAGVGTPGLIGLGAGVFAAGTYTINGIGDGANAQYLLIGWTGSATTADAGIAGWVPGGNMFGESSVFTTATSSLLGTPSPPLPVNLRTTFGGMTLVPNIPEPATFALAGLGLAALLVFRRRN
jgi:hypothetical protein